MSDDSLSSYPELARQRRDLEGLELEALRAQLARIGLRIVEAGPRPSGRWKLVVEPADLEAETGDTPSPEAMDGDGAGDDDLVVFGERDVPTVGGVDDPSVREKAVRGEDALPGLPTLEEDRGPETSALEADEDAPGPAGDETDEHALPDLFPAGAGAEEDTPKTGSDGGPATESDEGPTDDPEASDGDEDVGSAIAFAPLPGEVEEDELQPAGENETADVDAPAEAAGGEEEGGEEKKKDAFDLPGLPPLEGVGLADPAGGEEAEPGVPAADEEGTEEALPRLIGGEPEEADEVEEHEVDPEPDAETEVGELDDDRFQAPPEDADLTDLTTLAENGESGLRVVAGQKRKNRFRDASDDPRSRAKRLARTLASDILAYRPDEDHREALEAGVEAIRQTFRDDIRHALSEYEGQIEKEQIDDWQVIFVEAVNEIIGNGQEILAAS